MIKILSAGAAQAVVEQIAAVYTRETGNRIEGEYSAVGAMKARDLQRDPRFAIHANPSDPTMAGGDAKIAGRAVEVTEPAPVLEHPDKPPEPYHLFHLEIDEAVLTSLHPDGVHLVVETWRPGKGIRRVERT